MSDYKMLDYLSTPVGIHRLMKGPYDDREIFDSVDDLMDYCKNGARYDGQKVAVKFKYYIQKYTIRNDIPLLELDNQEIIYDIKGTGNNMEGWVLVYYYSGQNASNRNYFHTRNRYTYLDDPFAFMMFDTLGIFRDDNNELTFALERMNASSDNNVTRSIVTQTEDPITGNNNFGLFVDNSLIGYGFNFKLDSTSSGDNLMPLVRNTVYIDRLWVRADKYLDAAGLFIAS